MSHFGRTGSREAKGSRHDFRAGRENAKRNRRKE